MIRRGPLAGMLASIAAASFAHAQMPPATEARGFDRAANMSAAATQGFDAAEERFLAAAAGEVTGPLLDLARFYMAQELWVEALATLKRLAVMPPAAHALAAECEYRSGRYGAVALRLGASAPDDPLLAMALSRLGAYAEARQAFTRIPPPDGALRDEYFLTAAEAALEEGDAEAAENALRKSAGVDQNRRRFLAARLYAARGAKQRAALAFRSATGAGDNEWSMRARLALAIADSDVVAIERLSLKWQGGAFERDMLLALGRLRLDGGDFDRGFVALRRIVDAFPQSDAAIAAEARVAGELSRLFADGSTLDAVDAARLFFENVEFAPPGREGDELIQQASKRLQMLGLHAQAAQLLDHQVFKRLRGGERATIAAELAEIHIAARNAEAALRVIRSTRIAGLPESVNQERLRLEARALAETGEDAAAFAVLSRLSSSADIKLRGDINWSRQAWAAAAGDYAALVAAKDALTTPEDRALAVRAATAFLLAGDRAGYRAFVSNVAPRLQGTPEADLISTLGDVDRERFISGFMGAYRAAYAAGAS
jgi:hypothetical protein